MPRKLLSFGEALWDLLPSGRVLGGAPLNLAYRAASLGFETALVTRLGNDGLGREANGRIGELGIDLSWVQTDAAHPTGTVVVSFDADRNPSYVIVPDVAYDFIEATPAVLEAASSADCLCYGTLAQRSRTSAETLVAVRSAFRGAIRVCDVNLRESCYTAESVRGSIESAQIVKMNDGELPEVAEYLGLTDTPPAAGTRGDDDASRELEATTEIARRLVAATALEYCVVTMGASGALAVSRGGDVAYEAAFSVTVDDPCGAGDAFTAAFVHKIMDGASPAVACRWGNAFGALVTKQPGATHFIDPQAVEKLVDTRSAAGAPRRK